MATPTPQEALRLAKDALTALGVERWHTGPGIRIRSLCWCHASDSERYCWQAPECKKTHEAYAALDAADAALATLTPCPDPLCGAPVPPILSEAMVRAERQQAIETLLTEIRKEVNRG